MFQSNAASEEKNAIIGDIINISNFAYQYRVKPTSLGGGNGSYAGFVLPPNMTATPNGSYTAVIMQGGEIVQIVGTSARNPANTITAHYDLNLLLSSPSGSGGGTGGVFPGQGSFPGQGGGTGGVFPGGGGGSTVSAPGFVITGWGN